MLEKAFERKRKSVASDPYHWAVQTVWMLCLNEMQALGEDNVIAFTPITIFLLQS
jgi:hypothetical protein